jgi:hypothetical protein
MPLISSYGDLSEIKLDYSIIIEVTNLVTGNWYNQLIKNMTKQICTFNIA